MTEPPEASLAASLRPRRSLVAGLFARLPGMATDGLRGAHRGAAPHGEPWVPGGVRGASLTRGGGSGLQV